MGSLDVTVLTTSYPISEQSVSGVFVARLLQAMPENIRITVLTPAAPGFQPMGASSNIRVKTFRYAPDRWQLLAHQPGGIPVALAQNPFLYLLVPIFLLSMFIALLRASKNTQLIHANWSICGYVAGLAGRLRKIPVVTTLRGEDLNRAATSWVHDFLVRSTLRSSYRIVTVSDAFSKRIEENYPEFSAKCETIPNGVGDEFIRIGGARTNSLSDAEQYRSSPLRLISVGSLIPRKGMNVVLKAIAQLPEPGEVLLSIAGDGPEMQSLQSLAEELGIAARVTFVGEQSPSEIATLLQFHDVFILASHSEGRPNVVLEAKAAGLPVLASDIDGVREIVDHDRDGLLFDDNAEDQLATHIQHLLQRPDVIGRYAMQAHRSIVENKLTWHRAAEQYQSVYRAAVLV